MPRVGEKRREEVRGILAQFRQSGLTQRRFAKQEGVTLSSLVYWLKRERLEQEISGGTALVAVAESEPARSNGFFLDFEGIRIEVPRDVTVDEWKRLRDAWLS